ncbi:three component ABC system middle component [Plebeiibacterium marinum]|uniref:DUF6521 family protein n=1 Tax=Plebeiibacterium marinum TaxID=2992111 RepID=A0AAE3MI08_9BACT|nr:three component ABC system middle component [Plebeiobacterium marinum]MCW3808017.1 DUF6521 family protein [Plebeiobacterium marinum]
MRNNYFYNNEAIGLISIYSVLQKIREINIAKITLVLPLLFHEKSLKHIMNDDFEDSSIEEFTSNTHLFVNFNDRFKTYLPICLNVISIMKSSDLISFDNNVISINEQKEIDISKAEIGNRGKQLHDAGHKLANILIENETNLFYQLRVIL